jgi:tol-pal system protein YbgF
MWALSTLPFFLTISPNVDWILYDGTCLGSLPFTSYRKQLSARGQFEKRNYEQAKDMWAEFAQKYPEHELVPNAIFWQGESYYQMREYARAVLKYQEVIDNHKDSTKYRAALLKQGISFMRLGRVKAGRLLLQDVVDKFPDSPEGKRAQIILSGN